MNEKINSKNENINKVIDNKEFVCNYDMIFNNIKELNSLLEFDEPKIHEYATNKAKFQINDYTIKLTMYKNGLMLYDGPFRSFAEGITRKFCIDLMDGYYPSELQEKYPEGVKFDLVDKRDIYFSDLEKNTVYKTRGYRLGSGSKETCIESKASSKIKFRHIRYFKLTFRLNTYF
jgi:UBX domain-containing protein 11